MRFFGFWILTIFIVLSSCTETTKTSSGIFGEDVEVKHRPLFGQSSQEQIAASEAGKNNVTSAGSDQFLRLRQAAAPGPSQSIIVPADGEMVEISLVNASIQAAAQAVLGDALKKTFVVSDQVSGRITLQSTGPIPQSALLDLFAAALSANGAKMQETKGIIHVIPGDSGNRSFRLASDGVEAGANIIVARLEFVSAAQMINILDPLISEGLTAIADRRRNLLLLTGEQSQTEAALDALNLFDVDVMAGKSIAIHELSAADPDAVADELVAIFENDDGGTLDGVIEFIPNKRLGAVLVVTSRARYLKKAEHWIRKLDKSAHGETRYIETYVLQNRAPDEVATILGNLMSGSASQSAGSEGSTSSSSASRDVASDSSRNAILVRATRQEHREIKRLLRDLDSSPQQVMLEATIAEVTLNDELSLGVRWFFESGNFDFTFSDASSGTTGGSFPGFSAVFGAGGDLAAINALAGVTDVKIISSPTLMVLDNQEAILQIGDEVPVATQSSTDTSTSDAPTITTIEYRDTGIILSVKPNISRNGRVILDVTQEISSVAETQTSGIDSPTIRQRKIKTNVLLLDGSTLALGGLVQESNTKTVTKVPGLGDAPILGTLFRRTESNKNRSELLILIRPRVIDTALQGRSATEYWRSKLSGANAILGTGLGTAKHTIGEIVR